MNSISHTDVANITTGIYNITTGIANRRAINRVRARADIMEDISTANNKMACEYCGHTLDDFCSCSLDGAGRRYTVVYQTWDDEIDDVFTVREYHTLKERNGEMYFHISKQTAEYLNMNIRLTKEGDAVSHRSTAANHYFPTN